MMFAHHHPHTAFGRAISLLALASVGFLTTTNAQEAPLKEPEPLTRSEQLYQEFLKTAEVYSPVTVETEKAFTLQETPLMRFSVDGNVFGSVFIWHDDKKTPAMIGTIGSIPLNRVDTEFVEFHLLQPTAIQPLTVTGLPPKFWNPDHLQLKPRPIDGAPKVAGKERTRMVQMRSLARRFSGEMVQNGQTNQLRLLPQPLYRLKDSTSKRDYALFALVFDKGTDPEILLSIQAVENDGGVAWHYQPIRFSWRELTLRYEDSDVWYVTEFVERDRLLQNTPYLTGLTRPLP